ncbi:unnamed protein product [Chondrus crispus]|uniref:Uncharacterized protein n=1 Tax=Chondrus crispus TaxID=2769 RepID=R7Q6Y4_CHOCR|nr:unnamed protein product [Chondrus crispus]CDF33578.1 unnamed protein product [Chondrus crispus]|eukprot:XP_005713381.1 unnamed protein product [Chondrus crispus]
MARNATALRRAFTCIVSSLRASKKIQLVCDLHLLDCIVYRTCTVPRVLYKFKKNNKSLHLSHEPQADLPLHRFRFESCSSKAYYSVSARP